MQSKVITSKLHPPTSVCFTSRINIIHEYTETESKQQVKLGTHSMWETNVHNALKLKIMPSEVRLKILKFKKINILFMLIITVQIFSLC